MSLRIVHYNDPVLRRKGMKVTRFDDSLRMLARRMIAAMHEAAGIGLAAPQVGETLQLCVVDLRQADIRFNWQLDGARPPLELFMPLVIANPQVAITPGTPETLQEEGCLSFPEIRGEIARREGLTITFQDEHAVPHSLTCDELLARCILHEVDHLNGILFIDRMNQAERTRVDKAVRALARETRAAAKS